MSETSEPAAGGPSGSGTGGDPSDRPGGSAPDSGDRSGGVPASGGKTTPGSATGSAADPSPAANSESEEEESDAGASVEGSTGPADESAERFPPEAGREDDRLTEPGEAVDPIERERDEYRDALVRLQADFENYKKRMVKQQTEHLERAAGALVDKLLPVLDTADLALAHGGGEDVKQITGALIGALEREGLERIAGEGAPFDPTLHDAVMHEPGDDGGEQVVVEVLRAGYRWKGRVLRPAMVKVRG